MGKTNELSRIARQFLDSLDLEDRAGLEVKDITDSITALPGVTLLQGYRIECLLPEYEGNGARSYLFARERNAPIISRDELEDAIVRYRRRKLPFPKGYLDFTEALSFEDSEEGIWSAFLVKECWRFLPLWWHCLYEEQKWLLDADMLLDLIGVTDDEIEMLRKDPQEALSRKYPPNIISDGKFRLVEQIENKLPKYSSADDLLRISERVGDESLLPSVRLCRHSLTHRLLSGYGTSRWELKFVFFTSWGGLIHPTLKAVWKKGTVSFELKEDTTLLGYECGIRW